MAAFPTMYHHGTLVHTPIVEEETYALDPVIRNEAEAGYVMSRARFTRTPRKWSLRYEMLKDTNKDTLQAFEDTRVGGSESFTWTNPIDSVAYTVRFFGAASYVPVQNTGNTRWTVAMVLEEA